MPRAQPQPGQDRRARRSCGDRQHAERGERPKKVGDGGDRAPRQESDQRSARPRARRLRAAAARPPTKACASPTTRTRSRPGCAARRLLEDFILREKITHFDHERIPERIVHARGSGAHGYFECYESLEQYTAASLFAEAGKRTPVFVRFSTVAGERGSTDTARDVRGFAVKFYTDEGNWDLVGNNIPVFFIQDAMKFPDLVHAVEARAALRACRRRRRAHDTFWDFVSLMPESTHMLMWAMSDRAIPRSYRMMQGFGVHTFRLVNAEGESQLRQVPLEPGRRHALARLGRGGQDLRRRSGLPPPRPVGGDRGGRLPRVGARRADLHRGAGREASASTCSMPTKIVPEELVPVTPVGRMVLNRNPDNFFAETEQVAFCTAHIVPGIDFCNDPLLAGRIHSYVDTQISRLGGPNFHEIPINAPVAQVHNNQRDGMHRQAINRGRVAYEPNSLGGGCPFQAGATRLHVVPAADPRGQGARQAGEVRRPLHAGAAVLEQPDAGGEGAHHSRLPLRADQGADAGDARAHGGVARQRRRRAGAGVAEGLGMEVPAAAAEGAGAPAASPRSRARRRCRSSRGRATAASARGGSRSWSPTASTARRSKALHAGLLEAGAVPRFVGARLGQVEIRAGRSDRRRGDARDRRPRCSSTRSWCPAARWRSRRCGEAGHALEFIKDQYRHCKPISRSARAGAAGEGRRAEELSSGEADPGVLRFAVTARSGIAEVRRGDREAPPLRAGDGSAAGVMVMSTYTGSRTAAGKPRRAAVIVGSHRRSGGSPCDVSSYREVDPRMQSPSRPSGV